MDKKNVKIVILDGFTTNPGDLSWKELEQLGELTIYDRTKPQQTIERAVDAEIVLTNKVCIGKKEMEALPRLRYIGVLGTGYNVVDVEEARNRGIIVANVPAYSTDSVAQMVFAHLLTIAHHVEYYAHLNRQGKWSKSIDFCYWDTPLTELAGKTMGIVGLGNIGMRVAAIAQVFGMQVIAYTSKPTHILPAGITKVSLDKLYAHSDVISLHCPLNPDTHEMIDAHAIRMMKPTAILINTGRGPLVNEKDVADALHEKRIAAYCADVLSQEPPQADNPLLQCPNAYITQHISWATYEARIRLIDIATENVRAFIQGKPQNVVS